MKKVTKKQIEYENLEAEIRLKITDAMNEYHSNNKYNKRLEIRDSLLAYLMRKLNK